MKTDDLIDMLSRDSASEPPPVRSLVRTTALAAVPSLLVVLLVLGLRLDWPDLTARAGLALKLLLALSVVALAFTRLRSATRPEVSLAGSLRAFALPLALALLLALGSLTVQRAGDWTGAMFGDTLAVCLTAIPLLSLPMLAAILWVLRQGAVSDALRAGLLAGLLAGGTSVLIYALHCTEDDPAFFGLWYTLGVTIVMLLGGLIGRQVLRW